MSSKFIVGLKFIAGILLMILNAWIWINGYSFKRKRNGYCICSAPDYRRSLLASGWYKTQ